MKLLNFVKEKIGHSEPCIILDYPCLIKGGDIHYRANLSLGSS